MNINIAPDGVGRVRWLSDVLAERIERMRHQFAQNPSPPTGIDALDRLLGPVQPGWSTLVASREAVGRTTLAVQMAIQQASTGRVPLLMSSTLSADEVAMRVLAIEAEIPLRKLLETRLTEHDWTRIGRVASRSRRQMIVAGGVRRVRDLVVAVSQALSGLRVPSVLILDDVNVLLDDLADAGLGAFDLFEAMTSSSDVALILTVRLDSHGSPSAARTRLLDDIPNRVARNIVVLEPDERSRGVTANVIRTATGATGSVELVRGPRSPRFYGVAEQEREPSQNDHGAATHDAFASANRGDHDD